MFELLGKLINYEEIGNLGPQFGFFLVGRNTARRGTVVVSGSGSGWRNKVLLEECKVKKSFLLLREKSH